MITSKLSEIVEIAGASVNPQRFPSEQFHLFSIPAYEVGQPESKNGETIKSNKTVIKYGDVLFSKLNPRIPRVWLVPECREGRMICSTEFVPLRVKKAGILNPEYLRWMLLAPQFLGPIQSSVRSSTRSHQRIRPELLLEQKVPVVSIVQQIRIVERINEMMERVREIECLSEAVPADLTELKRSLVFGTNGQKRPIRRLSELVEWVQDSEQVKPHHDYVYAGIRSFGKGLFIRGTVNSDDFAYKSVRRLKAGDFIFPKLMAWEGAFAMVTEEFEDMVVSPEFVVFRPINGCISSEVLDTYFRSPACLEDVCRASTGSNRRRRRLNPRPFLNLTMPVPPIEEQDKLKAVYKLEKEAAESWRNRSCDIEAIRDSILRKAFAGEL